MASSTSVAEPPTNGKVRLVTSRGNIDVELWPKEAPLACRNFVQLCLEGYYDHTIFHRIIKGFMVQGGDPTGTGSGGESAFGHPFRDEIHRSLVFSHRGLLASANENAPSTNGSQFFFTLGEARHLDGKHTIFGKIVGPGIFVLANIASGGSPAQAPANGSGDDGPVEATRPVGLAGGILGAYASEAKSGRRSGDRRGRGRESDTMARLASFSASLRSGGETQGGGEKPPRGRKAADGGYDGAADEDEADGLGDEAEAGGGLAWAAGTLRFTRHQDDALRAGGDDGLTTVDDREGRGGRDSGAMRGRPGAKAARPHGRRRYNRDG